MKNLLTLGTNPQTKRPFTIPLAGAATKKYGIFGKSGTGKTYTAAVLVEELLEQKVPVVVLDPVGVWAGLGLSADGKSPGYPIAIFGGKHGQVELTPEMGGAIARYVADSHVPTVIDLSLESKGTWRRVVADFCETLFRVNELPVQVVIEEAPEFVPQRLFGENAVVFGAVDKVVRLGRNHGIGVTLIGQRLQTTNKDVVSQVDALILMRLVDPQGRKAALDWIREKGESEEAQAFYDQLPSLPTGTGMVWSPEWLQTAQVVQFRARRTYHYDADRAAAELPTVPIAQAVNTTELKRTFAKFVAPAPEAESKKGSDTASRKRIQELSEQVERLSEELEAAQGQVLDEDEIERRVQAAVQAATAETRARLARFEAFALSTQQQAQGLFDGSVPVMAASSQGIAVIAGANKVAALVQKVVDRMSGPERKLFTALAELYPDFPEGITVDQWMVEAGYKDAGGRVSYARKRLRTRKLILEEGGLIRINEALLK